MSFNVNFLGSVPYNTDLLPERSFAVGPGTERPIGFAVNEMCNLYWTVRSFKVNFTAFVAGDLSVASCNSAFVKGYTKLFNGNVVRIREQPSHIDNSKTQTSIALDKTVDPNKLIQRFSPVNEATICSAGPSHRIASSVGTYVLIDFSDIVITSYGFYWPRIIILASSNCFSLGSLAKSGGNIIIQGGVNFCNLGYIPLYGRSTTSSPSYLTTFVANGEIQPGDRCCDRFFWDGRDYSGEGEFYSNSSSSNCKKDCQSVEVQDDSYKEYL